MGSLFLGLQRAKVVGSTQITTEIFNQWKKKKLDEKEAGLALSRAERAKNDRMRYFVIYDYVNGTMKTHLLGTLLNILILLSVVVVASCFWQMLVCLWTTQKHMRSTKEKILKLLKRRYSFIALVVVLFYYMST